jgi:hypothetical protein
MRGSIGLFMGAILWMSPVSAQGQRPDLATLRVQCTNASGTGSMDAVMRACVELEHICPAPCIAPGELAIEVVTSGLVRGSYVSVKVNGGLNFTTSGNGSNLIPLASINYAVTVLSQPSGQTCTVENGAGVVAPDTRPKVMVKCSGQRSIGGLVSGLSDGEHVQLYNLVSQEVLTVDENGRYRFDAEKKVGEEYAVVVNQSPPGKKCTLAGEDQGVVGTADITDLIITCVPLPLAVAASAVESSAVSATLKRDSLMLSVFPGWQRAGKAGVSYSVAPASEVVKVGANSDLSGDYFVEPLGVIRIDEQHATMLTTAMPIDPETGEVDNGCSSSYCAGSDYIGAYFFTLGDEGWKLTGRQEFVTKLEGDYAGKFKTQMWPGHGLVVSFTPEYGYQGQSVINLTMLALQPNKVISLLETSLSKSSNLIDNSDTPNCQIMLDPKYTQPEGLDVGFTNCGETVGHWEFQGDELKLVYRWATREGDEKGRLKPLKLWETITVVQWTDSKLKLVKGQLQEFGI